MNRERMMEAADGELIGALIDIHATLDNADALDRAQGGDRGGKYRDEAAEIRAELWRRWNCTAQEVDRRVEQAKREIGMFGMTSEDLREAYGPTSTNWRCCGGPIMLAASIMSDAQHLIAQDPEVGPAPAKEIEEARLLLNRAKWVLFEATRIEREAERKAG